MRTVLFTQNTFSLVFSHINKGLVNLRHKDWVGVRKVFYCFTYLRFSLDTCACRDITSSMYFSLPVLQCTYWSVTPMIPNHSKSLESLDIFHAKSYINNADCRKIKQKSVLGVTYMYEKLLHSCTSSHNINQADMAICKYNVRYSQKLTLLCIIKAFKRY